MASKSMQKVPVWVEATDLAALVSKHSRTLPAEDRDWLTEPICHAAKAAVDAVAEAWRVRRAPLEFVRQLTAAEADVAEVQTWALLALRHGHWSHRVADDLDRRCESILDHLMAMVHHAHRWSQATVPTPLRLAA